MNLKPLAIFLLPCILCLQTLAQAPKVTSRIGDSYVSTGTAQHVIGNIGNTTFVKAGNVAASFEALVFEESDAIGIVSYDHVNMKMLNEVVYPYPIYNGRTTRYHGTDILGDHILLLFGQFDGDTKTHSLLGVLLDEKIEPVSDMLLLDEVVDEEGDSRPVFSFNVSHIKQKLTVTCETFRTADSHYKADIHVFDAQLKAVSNRSLRLPLKSTAFTVIVNVPEEDGGYHIILKEDLYGTLKESLGRKAAKEQLGTRGSSHQYSYLKLDDSGTLLHTLIPGDDAHPVCGLSIRRPVSADGKPAKDLFLVGSYSGPNGEDRVLGFFTILIHPDGHSLEPAYVSVDQQIITDLVSPKDAKKGLGLHSLLHRGLFTLANGTYILVSEAYYYYGEKSNFQSQNITITHNYEYGHLMASGYSANGEHLWSTTIPKKQFTKDDSGRSSSYIPHLTPNGLSLIYNDHPENGSSTTVSDVKELNNLNFAKAILAIATVDKDGNVDRQTLDVEENKRLIVDTRVYRKLDTPDRKSIYILGTAGILNGKDGAIVLEFN